LLVAAVESGILYGRVSSKLPKGIFFYFINIIEKELDLFVKLLNTRFDTDKVESWITLMTTFYKKNKKILKVKAPKKKKSRKMKEQEEEESTSSEEIDLNAPSEATLKRKILWQDMPL
jgi:hypothetical protein